MDPLTSLAAISASSQQLVNLASAFLGGSVVLLIGISHVSPPNKKLRSIYFLLVACWGFILASMLSGDSVLRNYLAAMVAKSPEKSIEIYAIANGNYADQLDYLRLAVLFFAIWLLLYMTWWTFFRESKTGATEHE